MHLAKPCRHVPCKTCTDTLVMLTKQCVVCDVQLGEKDIFELTWEETGYAAGGLAGTSEHGLSYRISAQCVCVELMLLKS
ncbi:hypothetical protein BD310DRAFT_928346 [Dichomitus squalens]|uniref:RING-type domain-containing protein n=1 Tax=Dichomitus squalens TaxID=114155 RepID=A0A4Q9PU42_9APHY|nr:hypothetical protein BD310DRAFT_928346 [Dichomitus squalens]